MLLQSSLKLWNDAEGHSTHPLPLTLSSTVKKYCKKLVRDASTTQQLRDQARQTSLCHVIRHLISHVLPLFVVLLLQLAAKDEVISSLSSSVSQLKEDCQLLRDILPDSTLAGQSRPTSVLTK